MTIFSRSALLAAPFLLIACSGEATQNASAAGRDASAQTASDQNDGEILASDKILGDRDAPVTLIEYASVTCGGCAQAHANLIPEVKENYIDTGKVKLVFREYPKAPSSLVTQSFLGSVLARCAGEQGGDDAFFLVIDALLKTQRTWIGGDTEAELKKIAAQAGMNDEAFERCVTTRQDLLDVINGNIKIAEETHKITGTPSFILDGERMTFRSYDEFAGLLDAALGIDPAGDDATDEDAQGDDPAAAPSISEPAPTGEDG